MKMIFPRYRDASEEETEEVNEHVKRIITKKKNKYYENNL